MKVYLLVSAFLGLVFLLNHSEKKSTEKEQGIQFVFAQDGDEIESLNIQVEEETQKWVVSLKGKKSFLPGLKHLKFKAENQACKMIKTNPVLFSCTDGPFEIEPFMFRGRKAQILNIFTMLLDGDRINENGHLEEEKFYAIKGNLLIGSKVHSFMVYSDPEASDPETKEKLSIANIK